MLKKYSLLIPTIFILTTFSSCGFDIFDISESVDHFSDFSPEESLEILDEPSEEQLGISHEVIEDCGCYGPPSQGNCNKMYAPVCGCDGITYDNSCVARMSGIYIYKRGECGKPNGNWGPWPVNPPVVVYPIPSNPPIVNPQPTNYPEAKPWPANPRKPSNYNPPGRKGTATLVQSPNHRKPTNHKPSGGRGSSTLVQTPNHKRK